jgi:hypothetical protein
MFNIMAAAQTMVRFNGANSRRLCWSTDAQHAQGSKLLAAVRDGETDLAHELIKEGANLTVVDKVHVLASCSDLVFEVSSCLCSSWPLQRRNTCASPCFA